MSLGTILSVLGGLGLSGSGIVTTWVLLQYRVDQLEKKLEKMEYESKEHEVEDKSVRGKLWDRLNTHVH